MKEYQIVRKEAFQRIINKKPHELNPVVDFFEAKAPVNIALIKYWGKRDSTLNLPLTDSLSIALSLWTSTRISRALESKGEDIIMLNGQRVAKESSFSKKIIEFLSHFRPDPSYAFSIETYNDVPTAAGLASSASGFAALTLALDGYFGLNLSMSSLSQLARLGSGSASRSVYSGLSLWKKGIEDSGKDSFAVHLPFMIKGLKLGIILTASGEKSISSRDAMELTRTTSPLFKVWPNTVSDHIERVFSLLHEGYENDSGQFNFKAFGEIVEQNALAMHATMLASSPPVLYWNEKSVEILQKVFKSRRENPDLHFYATIDAGPHIKILFLDKDQEAIQRIFPDMQLVDPLWEGMKSIPLA